LENIVWREFLFQYGFDNIKYWRTSQDNEVDFIIEDKLAYEVKFNKNLIREKKYESFREKYPNIPLEFITFENVLQEVIMK
jgi:predicted AAA+ superfamily ATPase